MMIRTIYSLAFFFSFLVLVSCSEEKIINGADVEEGIPVVLKLSYGIGDPEVVETKSALTDGLVWDLYVLLFDESGKRVYPEDNVSSFTFSGGKSGEISLNTTSGKRYIYGVANVDNAIFKDLQARLDGIKERSELEALPMDLENKVVQFSSERYLMSGFFTEGTNVETEPEVPLLCNIVANENGTGSIVGNNNEGLKGSIKLVRLFSVIRFNFSFDGTKVSSFVPTTWDVVNVPASSSLYKNDHNTTGEFFPNLKLNKYSNPVDYRGNTFEFAMLENKQTVTDGVEVSTDNDREDLSKAPANSTYVVLRGHYIGSGRKYTEGYDGTGTPDDHVSDSDAKVEADVEYFIHLGRGDVDKADYKSLRNKIYNYNVRITGIDKIITEVVVTDPYHRANGDVTYVEGDVTTVDAHYVTKVLTFSESDLTRGTEFQVKTPFSGGRYLKISDAGDAAVLDSWDWVHFMINDLDGDTYGTYSESAQRYPLKENRSQLMDVATFKKYLDNELEDKPLIFDGNGQLKVTCFIDEYYYPHKHWSEFVNKEPRVLQVFCRYKEHNNSSLTDAKYVIQQKSIYTFYALDENLPTAWGIEWKNENDPLWETASGAGSSWSNGRGNMIADMELFSVKSWYKDEFSSEQNSSLMADYAACMSRNRDEDGDGEIDEDEIKWYLPAINQYTDLWLGNEALASGYPLYQKTGDWVHFISNTDRNGKRLILWGEEGSSFGDYSGDGSIFYNELRCVRNLGMNDSEHDNIASDEPSTFYSYSDHVFHLTNMNEKALRGQFIETGELEAHKHTSLINMPYKAFRVSSDYVSNIMEESFSNIRVYAVPKDYPDKEMPKYKVRWTINTWKSYPKYEEYKGYYYFYDNPGSGWIKDDAPGMLLTRPEDADDKYKVKYYRYYKLSQTTNLGNQITLSKVKELVAKNQSPCKNYSEVVNGRTITGWRMPNQRELALMVVEKGDLGLIGSTSGKGGPYTFSYTEFEFTLGRYFVYGGNLRLTNPGDDPSVYIRCVKDIDE